MEYFSALVHLQDGSENQLKGISHAMGGVFSELLIKVAELIKVAGAFFNDFFSSQEAVARTIEALAFFLTHTSSF